MIDCSAITIFALAASAAWGLIGYALIKQHERRWTEIADHFDGLLTDAYEMLVAADRNRRMLEIERDAWKDRANKQEK